MTLAPAPMPVRGMNPSTSHLRRLSPLERRVLAYIANGATTVYTAARLELGETTVRAHLSAIARASGCSQDDPVQKSIAVAMRRGDLVFDGVRRQFLPQVWV